MSGRLKRTSAGWGLTGTKGGLEAAEGRYCQSGRSGVYEQYFDILSEKGLIYPCFCSRAELHAADAPHLSDGRYFYPGTCRNLTPEEAAEKGQKAEACLAGEGAG